MTRAGDGVGFDGAASSASPLASRLIGYADQLSTVAGDRIQFFASGDLGGDYQTEVHRLLGGGSHPEAPALQTEPIAALGSYPLHDQPVRTGSYGLAPLLAAAQLPQSFTVAVRIQPSLLGASMVAVGITGDVPLELGVDPDGNACLTVGDQHLVGPPVRPAPAWNALVAVCTADHLSLAVAGTDTWDTASGWQAVEATTGTRLSAPQTITIGATRRSGQMAAHFAGRLERPVLLAGSFTPRQATALVGVPGDPMPPETLAGWEFSDHVESWTVPGRGVWAADLTLLNAPKRAVCGSTWSGSTSSRLTPFQFGAVHFYPDSLEDCCWEAQADWLVPPGTASGFYAARISSDGHSDWIPFFVRPEPGTPRSGVLVVASTATYYAYANSRFWWEDPIQEIAQDRLVELGPQEQYLLTHPELGLSNYDLHADGTPVVFSSRRRPNLFMRPGHSRGESYSADLYLLGWLQHAGIRYDVITDEDLHFGGRSLLDDYPVVISGTHPEYLSAAMHDATRDWVRAGGRYLYLGGNGFTSCVTWSAERPWLMENRATGRMRVDSDRIRAEAVNQSDGTLGSAMADSGRSPGSLWGVDSVTMGFDRSYPLLRTDTSYDPAFAFAFAGIDTRLFGGRSLSGGGVIGQEWDNARLIAEDTAGHHVLASSIDHSLIPDVLGADPIHHGDVVLFFHDQGVIFSASAMAWSGALHIDDYDNDAERFVRNVLTRFLDPTPIPQPAATAAGRA